MNTDLLAKAANQARGLAIDAIETAGLGHLGLPLGAAEIGAVLYGEALNLNPAEPQWINRDRFVLSAGHGSMFLYAWLHMSGFNLSMDDVKKFRQLHSITPGHPEFGETDGVEATTGPLGQGIGNAVGMAVAQKHLAAQFNTPQHQIIDHHIVCLAGDGCLQEGVAMEACSFAGHFGLDRLILFYDSNDVTLDAMADATQSEDVPAKFAALEWNVQTIDGHDMAAVLTAYATAKSSTNGKPNLIIAKTEIARGIPEVAGTSKGHGEGGAKFAESARKGLGLPEERFFVSEEVYSYFSDHQAKQAAAYQEWVALFEAWQLANPENAAVLKAAVNHETPSAETLFASIPAAAADKAVATRACGGNVLNIIADQMPMVISGSADLFGSTKNYINSSSDFTRDNPLGRNLRFGIREHAMGAMVNGMSYYGMLRPSGATFLAFADYMRGAVRLSALAKLPNFQIWTHDSIGVGEDGPTHQPVEQTTSLRVIPGLDVIRPADAEETAGAFVQAITNTSGPTALILTRQNLPQLNDIAVADRRNGVLKGGYIARKETNDLSLIILASGSEVQHAIEAAKELGDSVRVVSMPSLEIFERQSAEYRESVIPAACRKRIAIEAGVSMPWFKYTGLDGVVLGIDRFGMSAPGEIVMDELGMNAAHIVQTAKSLLG